MSIGAVLIRAGAFVPAMSQAIRLVVSPAELVIPKYYPQ